MEKVRFARFSEGNQGIKIVFAPLFVAMKRGYFAEHGVELEMIEPQERFGWLELVHGRADLGAGHFTFPTMPQYRGRMKAVALHEAHNMPGCGFVSLMALPGLVSSGELNDYRSLKGKRIGLLPNRGDDYMTFHGALTQGGLTLEDVEVVPVPHGGPDRAKAIATRAVDVLITRRPNHHLEWSADGTLEHWKRGFDVAPFAQAQYLMGALEFIERRPEAGARFFAAYLRGARDYIEAMVLGGDKQGMIDLLVEMTDDTRATVAAMMPVWFPPNGRIDGEIMARDREILIGRGLYAPEVPLSDVLDHTLVDGALKMIGTSKLGL